MCYSIETKREKINFVEKEKNYQKEKNQSENALKRTIWRGCIQLKMNSFLLKSI